MHPTRVQRWSGLTRTVNDWDHGLRRDPELWYEDGDCYIHLHARGVSRRGPSFCIPYRILRQKKCEAMISQCDAQLDSAPRFVPQLKRRSSSLVNISQQPRTVQLFIPAPADVSVQASFQWHITTRNFFAFLLGKSLVGEHMGQAFVDLQERLSLFRPDHPNNIQDFLSYAEDQGYRDLVECTDYALASLFYAEHYKLKDVWIDAFAHCVGMNESLHLSPEYSLTSKLTKALITRARREVDTHLERVSIAISNFLQEDLSPAYLGLTDGARSHLDRFRQFLHTFYAEKFGYWPPPRGATYPKSLYKSMYYDFKSLYDYLVDTDSTHDISCQRPASGGICVLQNVITFDHRHNFSSLPHPLPLLPTYVSPSKKSDSHKALRQLTLASQHQKTHELHTMSGALMAATNTLDQQVTNSKIVQAYMYFEKSHSVSTCRREEKITVMDARKVRWLLIYGTLQYLLSALQAPRQVRDSESSTYPLCYVANPTPKPTNANRSSTPPLNVAQAIDGYISEPQPSPFSIEPDCQREDYFSPENLSRRGSMEVSPLRQSSVRSLTQLSLSSLGSRRNSLKRQSSRFSSSSAPTDDVLKEAIATSSPTNDVHPMCSGYPDPPLSIPVGKSGPQTSWLRSRTPSVSCSIKTLGGSIDTAPRSPLLEFSQLDRSTKPSTHAGTGDRPSRSDSTSSTGSSLWSVGVSAASSKSSACDGIQKTSDAEESGLLGGLVPIGATTESTKTKPLHIPIVPHSHVHPLLRKSSRRVAFQLDFDNKQSGAKQDVRQPTEFESMNDLALSIPPSCSSPSCADTHSQPTAVKAHALLFGRKPCLPRSTSTVSAPDSTCSKGSPSTVSTATDGYWEQYKTTLTQQRARTWSNTGSLLDSTTLKTPFSRLSRPSNEENRGVKSDRRISYLWRR
ncbi:hypothetical protein ACJQWK_10788 [Exserohilum turcicum]